MQCGSLITRNPNVSSVFYPMQIICIHKQLALLFILILVLWPEWSLLTRLWGFFDGDVIPLLTPCCCRAARVKAACQQRHTSISPLSVSTLDRFSHGAHMHSEACWQSPLWNNVLNLRLTALIKKDLARVLHQKRPACSILRPPLFPKIEILSRIISLVWQHLTVGLHMFTLCPGKTVTLS